MHRLDRPNVLIIYTDQQRWDSLGCYGNHLAKTPNLDKLASRGALLKNFFVQNPVCSPSRMSFLTGRYCSSLGVGTNGVPFPKDTTPINQLLKPYGFHTGQIGKLHFDPHAKRYHQDPTDNYGFDTFILSDEPGCYDDAYIKWVEAIDPYMVDKVRVATPFEALRFGKKSYTDRPRNTHEPYPFDGEESFTHSSFVASEMCNYIEQHKDSPFFAIAGFYAPHCPINPPKRFIEMFDSSKMPLPVRGENESFDPRLKDVTDQQWQEIIASYYALVSHVDDCVGKIINKLESSDLMEKTLVIFTSDHGEYLGDHGRIQKGMPGHDCITRVPCIISLPGKNREGLITEELIEAVDIVPTILDYCGIQAPRVVQGKSIKDLLENKSKKHRTSVLTEFFVPDQSRQAVIRTVDYKYYCDYGGKEILYDLNNDPDELYDVSCNTAYKDVVSSMRCEMIHRLMEAAFNTADRIAQY